MAGLHNKKSHKASDFRLAARLLRYLSPYKWKVVAALLLVVVNVPLAAAGPLLTKAAIDLFIFPDLSRAPTGYVLWVKQGASFFGWGGSRSQGLIFIGILFLLANLIQSAIQYLRTMLTEVVGQNAIHDLRQEIFAHLQEVSIQFHERNSLGRLMTRVTSDVDALFEVVNSGMVMIFSHAAMVIYSAAWMFRINWRLAFVSCAVLLLMVAFAAWFRVTARPAFRRFREQIGVINAFLQEHIAGMPVVQIFNREKWEMSRFESINHAHFQAAVAVMFRNALFYPIIEMMLSSGMALILWYGGGHVITRLISMGSLIAFVQFAQSFYDPVAEISSRYPLLQAALASAENIFELLNEPLAVSSPGKIVRLGAVRGKIEFRNVWFAYQDQDWILKDVSFSVEPGEKVAFVGRTGAGKTTIANLLLRFYEIQSGQILLDNVDIQQMDIEELRSSFSVVPQEIFLFPGDIASNIKLGNQSITDERVRAAAREVYADEFIVNLERGYQSEILEKGIGLSVGQKQLIGFARALAFDRPILILDEATSSIDAQTEIQIREAVQRTMTGRTALVIAHRLSTIQAMDRILVMHNGEIRESGDHKSLIALRGLYWTLYQLQFHSESSTCSA
jgi:ATP-binding cassette subfamily B multidrug efflux pump